MGQGRIGILLRQTLRDRIGDDEDTIRERHKRNHTNEKIKRKKIGAQKRPMNDGFGGFEASKY
jgi:hypothetical protein